MITEKNLKRIGFVASEWVDLEDGDKYRTWANGDSIVEVEESYIKGKQRLMVQLNVPDMLDLPNVDSGSKIVQLMEMVG